MRLHAMLFKNERSGLHWLVQLVLHTSISSFLGTFPSAFHGHQLPTGRLEQLPDWLVGRHNILWYQRTLKYNIWQYFWELPYPRRKAVIVEMSDKMDIGEEFWLMGVDCMTPLTLTGMRTWGKHYKSFRRDLESRAGCKTLPALNFGQGNTDNRQVHTLTTRYV